jgi:hypothetical protein
MDPEAEKNAELFAELIEYREAMSALKEFGSGFFVSVERHWPKSGTPYYVAIITESGADPTQGTHENLLEAVRLAVEKARRRMEPPPVVLGAVATGQQGVSNVGAGFTPGVPCVPAPKCNCGEDSPDRTTGPDGNSLPHKTTCPKSVEEGS